MKVGIGLRAGRGGAVAVAVSLVADAPRAVLSTFLATAEERDRLAFEPYHVAYDLPRGPDGEITSEAVAAVAEGRRRQEACALSALGDILRRVEDHEILSAALIVNRAGWVTNLVEYGLSAPEHAAVAEGLAVREALRRALHASGVATIEPDEKTLAEAAAVKLGMTSGQVDAQLTAFGASLGRPWRKEQKLAALAAWLAAAGG